MDRPAFHASLNATAAVLLSLGWLAIRGAGPWRRGHSERAHIRLMLAAFAVSTVFLASYVDYHLRVGRVEFWGTGWLRSTYFAILVPHTILAALMVPFIVATLVLGLRRRLPAHRRLARLTLPVWIFVSITGVLVWYLNFALRPA
jgi:putative membrane protein